MRKLFFLGLLALAVFEVASVWFIMPLPGSQRVRSVDVAYQLHAWRWAVRGVCAALVVAGLPAVWRGRRAARWAGALSLAAAALVVYATNWQMAADRMFLQPRTLVMAPAAANRVDPRRLVVGVEVNGDARAYPLQFIGYHHQVRDTVGGRPVLVSYCTVCRSGRVFVPKVAGRDETFRLVGMDQFNAMFEDRSTGSWWRQANGEAVAGPRRGVVLEEVPSRQTTLARWLSLHPASRVMQADPASAARYPADTNFAYESGASRSALTGTDTASWREKSWVVGVALGGAAAAYDWNRLRRERVVHDVVGGVPVVLALASDSASFFAFRRPSAGARYSLRGDSLVGPSGAYALSGRGAQGARPASLVPVGASQEFWHSWRTFHPGTRRY